MVDERLTDGVRIAELLASELHGGATPAALDVTDADPEVDPTDDGAVAYRVTADGAEVAVVAVQPDRAYVEFAVAPEAAAEAGRAAGLRTRPKAVQPPRTLVFVEDGTEVKRVLDAFRAVLDARDEA
jgi:hypothetical protein